MQRIEHYFLNNIDCSELQQLDALPIKMKAQGEDRKRRKGGEGRDGESEKKKEEEKTGKGAGITQQGFFHHIFLF